MGSLNARLSSSMPTGIPASVKPAWKTIAGNPEIGLTATSTQYRVSNRVDVVIIHQPEQLVSDEPSAGQSLSIALRIICALRAPKCPFNPWMIHSRVQYLLHGADRRSWVLAKVCIEVITELIRHNNPNCGQQINKIGTW